MNAARATFFLNKAQMAGESEAPRPKMTDGLPRHVLSRASLQQVPVRDAGHQAPARSVKSEGGHHALELPRAIAEVASPKVAHTTDLGHSNATHWLRNPEADEKAFEHTNAQLLWAATFCAAGFQISREFERISVELEVLIAANTQLTGWRQGQRLGPTVFTRLPNLTELIPTEHL